VVVTRKKYLFPAIFSALVVGLGQMVKGESKKGLKLMLWFYLGFPVIIYGSLLLNSYLFLAVFAVFVVIYPVIWSLNVIDAYSKQRPLRRRA
jgi:hypothetical protein